MDLLRLVFWKAFFIRVQCGNDVIVVRPTCAAWVRGTAERNRSSSRNSHLLELALSEETDPLSVRRKERKEASLGAGETRRLRLIQTPQR